MGPGTDLGDLGWFAGVWATMMAAMMLPSLVPMAIAYAGAARDRTGPASSTGKTAVFATGYLLPWALAGVAAWALIQGIRSLDLALLSWDEGGRYVAGGVIVGAALYELSPMKAICLRHCRNRGLLLEGWRPGAGGALRMGLGHGAYCIGCCWALMAALFALGVMSVAWMVVIAVLIAIDKLLPWRALAVGSTAALLVILGIAAALSPEQVPGLTIPGAG